MEVHDRPEAALSDGANALHLDRFVPLVDRLNQLAALVRQWGQHES
jgi:3-deoxy-D-manno-octulosonic acid (KDO) 8-phosphate synthase